MFSSVSVIIPNYNKGELIRHSLDCLLRQTYADWEAVVVDDCSTDISWNIIEEYAAKDSRIVALRNETNRGGCYSRNRGAKMAKGEFLLFLDSDDWLADDCLEKRIEEFGREENKNLDMLIFEMATAREDRIGSNWTYGDRKNALVSFLRHEIVWSIMMPIWRRVAFERFGGFDETFPRLQDVELHTRALLKGLTYRFAERKTPDCFYFVEESRMTTNHKRAAQNLVNAITMYVEKMRGLIAEMPDCSLRKSCSRSLVECCLQPIRAVGDFYRKGVLTCEDRDAFFNEVVARRWSQWVSVYAFAYWIGLDRIRGFNYLFRRTKRLVG